MTNASSSQNLVFKNLFKKLLPPGARGALLPLFFAITCKQETLVAASQSPLEDIL